MNKKKRWALGLIFLLAALWMCMAAPAASLSAKVLNLRVGDSYKLAVKGAGKRKVKWNSSRKKIATVSKKGVVKAKNSGSASITAKVAGKKYVCRLTVRDAVRQAGSAGASTGGTAGAGSGNGSGTGSPASSASSSTKNKNTSPDPINSNGLSGEELDCYRTMVAFRSSYPEGMTYTNADYYQWKGGVYRGGYGCAGFAFMLSDAYFGTKAAQMKQLPGYTSYIRVGDIIRLDYNTHSVIVLRVNSDHVIVAEANYNKSVHWGRKITFSEIRTTGTNVLTRYTGETRSMGEIENLWDTLTDLDGAEENAQEQASNASEGPENSNPAPEVKSEPKAEEPKPEPPKAEEPKPEPPKAEEPKPEPPKAEEPKPEPPKAEEPKPEPPKAEEPKPETVQSGTEGAQEQAPAGEKTVQDGQEQESSPAAEEQTEDPGEQEESEELSEDGDETAEEDDSESLPDGQELQETENGEETAEETAGEKAEKVKTKEEKSEEKADEKADDEEDLNATFTASLHIEWSDQENALDTRPGGIFAALVGSNCTVGAGEFLGFAHEAFAVGGVQTLSDGNGWTVTCEALKYQRDPVDGSLLKEGDEPVLATYTWLIENIVGYDAPGYGPAVGAVTALSPETTITLTLSTGTANRTSQTVIVEWDDNNNAEGYRPASVQMTLSDGQKAALTADSSWTATIGDLPLYKDAERIEYSWVMDGVPYYQVKEVVVDGTQTTFTLMLAPPVPVEKHKLTIRYLIREDGKTRRAFEKFVGVYETGNAYNVKSPVLSGYEASQKRVKGTIQADTTVTVYYTAGEYTLRVRYVFENGVEAAPAYETVLKTGTDYSVDAPGVAGYNPSRTQVTGTMEGRDMEVTVYYVPVPAPAPAPAQTQTQPQTQTAAQPETVEIGEYETPLGLGALVLNAGDCFE